MLLTKCVQLKGYCPFAANPCFRERQVRDLMRFWKWRQRRSHEQQISPCGVLALGFWPCEAAGMNVPDSSLETASEPHVLQQTCAALGGFSPMALRMKVPNSNFETLIEWSRVALQWLCKPLCAFEWLWFWAFKKESAKGRVETQKRKPDQAFVFAPGPSLRSGRSLP